MKQEHLPDELLWSDGGHASDIVLTAIADGQLEIVPPNARAHVETCTKCMQHLGNAALLSLFSLSCNSCRHVCGGYLNSFHRAPSKYKLWSFITRLNEKHMEYAWISLFFVALADLYVRLLSMGVISDLRFL